MLPYVVDAHATALARASASGAFDYAQWVKRPTTFFFAGNCVRKRGTAYVRLALTQLNAAFADARVHCSGVRETAYDRSGHCVPMLNKMQLKEKYDFEKKHGTHDFLEKQAALI